MALETLAEKLEQSDRPLTSLDCVMTVTGCAHQQFLPSRLLAQIAQARLR